MKIVACVVCLLIYCICNFCKKRRRRREFDKPVEGQGSIFELLPCSPGASLLPQLLLRLFHPHHTHSSLPGTDNDRLTKVLSVSCQLDCCLSAVVKDSSLSDQPSLVWPVATHCWMLTGSETRRPVSHNFAPAQRSIFSLTKCGNQIYELMGKTYGKDLQ